MRARSAALLVMVRARFSAGCANTIPTIDDNDVRKGTGDHRAAPSPPRNRDPSYNLNGSTGNPPLHDNLQLRVSYNYG